MNICVPPKTWSLQSRSARRGRGLPGAAAPEGGSGGWEARSPTSSLKEQPLGFGDPGTQSPALLGPLFGARNPGLGKWHFAACWQETLQLKHFSPNAEHLYLSESLHSVCLKGSARE